MTRVRRRRESFKHFLFSHFAIYTPERESLMLAQAPIIGFMDMRASRRHFRLATNAFPDDIAAAAYEARAAR